MDGTHTRTHTSHLADAIGVADRAELASGGDARCHLRAPGATLPSPQLPVKRVANLQVDTDQALPGRQIERTASRLAGVRAPNAGTLRRLAGWLLLVGAGLATLPGPANADVEPTEFWPRSKREINRTIKSIEKAGYGRNFSRASQDSLRSLNVRRYLAGAPHDVQLDAEYQEKAQAACELLALLGETTHYPMNPGWSNERFEPAALGARNSNLSGAVGLKWPMHFVVKSTMHDSDNDNLWKIGHRRWNLSPAMQRTGFGLKQGIGAIWVTDRSRGDDWGHEVIAWPPRGYAPVKYWPGPSKYDREPAWSIHLNPKVYALPPHGVPSVRMWKLKRLPPRERGALTRWRDGLWDDSALELHGASRLEADRSREPGLTWLPKKAALTKGARYWVEIQGLQDPKNGREKSIGYLVEGY